MAKKKITVPKYKVKQIKLAKSATPKIGKAMESAMIRDDKNLISETKKGGSEIAKDLREQKLSQMARRAITG